MIRSNATLTGYARRRATPYEVFRDYMLVVLDQCGGNVSEAARRMRMHRRTVQRLMSKRRTQRVTGAVV